MNRAADRVAPFYAVEINRLANARERRGLPVIHMEVGQPSAGAPAAAIAAGHPGARRTARRATGRAAALAERLERHYRDAYGLAIDHTRIILTMGASAALVLAMSVLFDRGARVAVPRPGYPAHRNALHALEARAGRVRLRCGHRASSRRRR